MRLDRMCLAGWVSIVVISFLTVGYVHAAGPQDDLSGVVRAAKGNFRKLEPARLDRAKKFVQAAVDRLRHRFQTAGDSAAGWQQYLLWERLLGQLQQAAGPDAAELQKVYARFAADQEGLGLVWFADVRDAIKTYLAASQAGQDTQLQPRFEAILEGLAQRLDNYAKNPANEHALWISDAVRWLDDTQQAPEVVQAVRQRCRYPNLFFQMAASVVAAGIAGPVDRTEPLTDVILGTSLYGRGHRVGQSEVQLVPDDNFAVFDTLLSGQVSTDNVGYNGPVTVWSQGLTTIAGVKRMWFTAEGLRTLPALADANTSSNITGLAARCQLIQRIGSRRAAQQKPQAEYIGSQHAVQRLTARMDREAAEKLAQSNADFEAKFRKPLWERRLLPELRFRSTADAVHISGIQANEFQVASVTAPPEPAPAADLVLRIHQSMVNNSATMALAGRTVRDETLQAEMKEIFGKVPDELKPDAEDMPWSVTFAEQEPITVSFGDNQVQITVRGRKFGRGDRPHPGMNVSATYQIVRSGDTVKGVRQGSLVILPPDFKAGRTLSGREIIIRDLLDRRFSKIFKPEIVAEGMKLPGNWEKAGTFWANHAASGGGWLVIAWNRGPDKAAKAAAE